MHFPKRDCGKSLRKILRQPFTSVELDDRKTVTDNVSVEVTSSRSLDDRY